MEAASQAAASLSEEGRYRLLVEAITDYAIYMLDTTGIVSSWNPGAQRFKGYDADEIIGQHFSRFYTEEDRASGLPARALATARAEGKFESEGWRVRKDGSRFWAYVVIDAIRDPSGETVGFAKITRDLTERRDAQEKLERTREAFIQSQKLEAIGQLTGGVAHDFNNLLMAVLGSLELMRKRLPDDPKLLSLLENAVRGAERGAALTKRMLTFARRQELKQEPIDIPELVRGMAELLQRSLGASVSLETRFPPLLPAVVADANQLELALLNLTVNARDAMPHGGNIVIAAHEQTITTAEPGLEPGRYLQLRVSDTGTGMDETTLRRATEPFFTTKEPGKGTGLGLSMVHGLAENFGGRFNLKSRLGEGTTAELWLPVLETRPDAGARIAADDKTAAAPSPLRIVAVDDDPLVLTNTVAMLEYLGHVCYAASSGQQALDILKSDDKIDLVITDQVMPKMTGLQLAKAIHSDRPDFPIILASGYAGVDQEPAMKVPLLAKPFTLEQLSAQIVRLGVQSRAGSKAAPRA